MRRSTRISSTARSIIFFHVRRRSKRTLSPRCGELIAVDKEVLVYDVTKATPQASRGYSRDYQLIRAIIPPASRPASPWW
jgi:hypothetical protein